ncbi:MAG TPA: hypothetical protein H9980_04595 [Candidatus Erysipelatoclostridium merdavium]|uniref:Dihydropteridine reductase n=1 Tax=Candidatus Erysipelatoclostridium merdavium TaxID=2838566 RepID=A0A9D2BMT0_9FIRM|nr:hypothetical protein [Candidatus Erysipelatoclostridium merdavium]
MAEDKFTYKYSAKEYNEAKKIRDKYLPKKESKLEQLQKLDQSVTKKATAYAITFGVLSSLLLGIGLYFTIELEATRFVEGIIIGCIGILGICLVYPFYKKILTKERNKISNKILQLSEEIMKNN